jgi:hypothetical protein
MSSQTVTDTTGFHLSTVKSSVRQNQTWTIKILQLKLKIFQEILEQSGLKIK